MQPASQLHQETRVCDAAACISHVVPLCSPQAISICGIPPGLVSPTDLPLSEPVETGTLDNSKYLWRLYILYKQTIMTVGK